MDAVRTIRFQDGAELRVCRDPNPESPREWDNLSTMVCFHKRYVLGDKHDYRCEDHAGWDALKKRIERDHHPVVILPLYMYDHSGITIRTTPFSCPWDSGQIGFVFVTQDKALSEFGHRLTHDRREQIKACVLAEVATYDQFLNGGVYGFEFVTPDGEIDSCWGFYGDDPTENGMADHLPDEYFRQLKDGSVDHVGV